MAKILYLPCHEILEHDQVKLLTELGHEVFSPGSFVSEKNRGDGFLRPDIDGFKVDPCILEQYHKIGAAHPGEDAKKYLTKEFIDNFQIVIVMHIPEWIEMNWDVIKHKKVIWRTIGQSVASIEQRMKPYRNKGMKILRYSPMEANIPHFAGQDGLIRFYKDPDEFKGWTGHVEKVVTFAQSMQQRGTFCNYKLFEEVTRPFPRILFGPNNNQSSFGMGKVSFDRLKKELRNNRCYFYTGTHPASYTLNFIESLMSGIPLVCIGPQYGNADVWRNHNLYEIQNIIQSGVNGFISDNPKELQHYVKLLLTDYELAKEIGSTGRQTAIQHFGKEMIKAAWNAFLSN